MFIPNHGRYRLKTIKLSTIKFASTVIVKMLIIKLIYFLGETLEDHDIIEDFAKYLKKTKQAAGL